MCRKRPERRNKFWSKVVCQHCGSQEMPGQSQHIVFTEEKITRSRKENGLRINTETQSTEMRVIVNVNSAEIWMVPTNRRFEEGLNGRNLLWIGCNSAKRWKGRVLWNERYRFIMTLAYVGIWERLQKIVRLSQIFKIKNWKLPHLIRKRLRIVGWDGSIWSKGWGPSFKGK